MNGSGRDVLLNIGCGLDAHGRWTNVDASPSLRLSKLPLVGGMLSSLGWIPAWPALARFGDVVRGIDIDPGSCELIFASHVLEHLGRAQCERAVHNLYAYLRPGGTLRVIVPDLRVMAAEYLRDESPDAADRFMRNSGLGLEDRGARGRLRDALGNARHQWLWDEPSLSKLLRDTGFSDVIRRGPGEFADTRFADVERADRHAGAICLEATR